MDPTIFSISYKKNRFYLFSKREPADVEVEKTLVKRDIQNEKTQKEESPLYAQPTEAVSAKQVKLYCVLILYRQ
jgi:hypothetical protein